MKKFTRILLVLIYLCILADNSNDLLPKALATSSMTASEACVEFVKQVEGFSAQPYYDHKQHTVGYGTKCPTEKYFDYMANGITKSEAEALLRETLADVSKAVNEKLIDQYHLTFTQNQFDALVSFSFNLGTAWMTYDSSLRNAILGNASEDEFVYAISLYSTASGNYSAGLVNRRLCEANMYLNGIYSKTAGDAYGYVFYEPNGGSLTYRVQGFICNNNTPPSAEAIRTGDKFLGWYTDLTGGEQVEALTGKLTGKTLFARWQSSENSENQDTQGTVVRVTGDVVNIRKGPGTNYGIANQVYTNQVLVVTHVTQLTDMKWGKVQDGWICLNYTDYEKVIGNSTGDSTNSDKKPDIDIPVELPGDQPTWDDTNTNVTTQPDKPQIIYGIVNVGDLLRIRSGPGTNYDRVGHLANGTKVEILELKAVGSSTWGRITSGWISMDYIIPDHTHNSELFQPDINQSQKENEKNDTSSTVEFTAIKGTIKADALRIRSAPSTETSIVGFYYQDETVYIKEKITVDSVVWGKTELGWINMSYVVTEIQKNEQITSSDIGTKTVIADCLRVRKQIGTDSRIAELLYYGDKVTVLETKTVDGVTWGRVANGWICMDYVK